MSWRDRNSRLAGRKPHGGLLAIALMLALPAAGCSVQPLYGDMTSSTGTTAGMAAILASVEVEEATEGSNDPRVAQELRNHLIFLLSGGAGQPADPRYVVDLRVTTVRTSAAQIQRAKSEYEPTAGMVTVRATYTIRDANTGETVSNGLRLATASFDISRQEFAALRAERDAENRAAREAAELTRLAIIQGLLRPDSGAIPVVVSAPEEIEPVFAQDGDQGEYLAR